MEPLARATDQAWTADAFLRTDQHAFGDAWRYELVEGVIVARAAPSPDHGAIRSGLTAALATQLAGRPNGCRPEAGSGDVPRVAFDVVSASELRNWKARDQRREHLQGIAGIQEIVEICRREAAIHVYRRQEERAMDVRTGDRTGCQSGSPIGRPRRPAVRNLPVR